MSTKNNLMMVPYIYENYVLNDIWFINFLLINFVINKWNDIEILSKIKWENYNKFDLILDLKS